MHTTQPHTTQPLLALPAPAHSTPEYSNIVEAEIVHVEKHSSVLAPAQSSTINSSTINSSTINSSTINSSTISHATIDIVSKLLQDKRSADTRRAYAADLRDFFGVDYTPETVSNFVRLPAPEIALLILDYKSTMLGERGLSEATVNRRLAAIKSLLKFANRLGLSVTDGRNLVDGEKTRAYRDTRGVDVKTLKKLLKSPEKMHKDNPVRVLRDMAILGLLIENALRRAEVCKLDIADFEAASNTLFILGKGRGSQRERITLSPACTLRIAQYLAAAPPSPAKYTSATKYNDILKSTNLVLSGIPLFRNLARNPEYSDTRLTPGGLYQLLGEYGRFLGLSKLTPHQLRHAAITAALDATKGDVRSVQKLSRHSDIKTLMIYDDNRADAQGQVTGLLSKLLG